MKFHPDPAAASIWPFRAASKRRPSARVLLLSAAAVGVLACSDRLSTVAPPVSATSPAPPTAGTLPVDSHAPSLPLSKPGLPTAKPAAVETPELAPMV